MDFTFTLIFIISHFSFLISHFIFQIGAIYLWSYVYNIMWIYSIKTNVEANMSDSTISRMSSGENPYGISKCSQGPLLPSNGRLFTEASSYQPELPCMIPEGTVVLCPNTIFPGTGLCLELMISPSFHIFLDRFQF